MKERAISKALEEVWEWKERVGKEIKHKSFEEKQRYYQEGLEEAEKLLKSKLIKNPDGSHCFLKA